LSRLAPFNYHNDGQLSTRQLTDISATVIDRYAFDAFGVQLVSSGGTPNSILYAGEQLDRDLGYYYLRSRYYSQTTGRLASMDQESGHTMEPLSLHKYLYAGTDPVNHRDPSGADFTVLGLNISSAMMNVIARIAIGAVLGAVFSGIDAYLRGDDVFQEALKGGLIGAATGGLYVIKFLRPVIFIVGYGLGLLGTLDAIQKRNAPLALYRGILTFLGARGFLREQGVPRPPGGRLGNPATRAQIADIAQQLIDQGWEIIGGGGRLPEEYLPPINGGGTKGSNFVDITARNPATGQVIRIQTVDTYSNGMPTEYEAAAAALISAKTNDPVIMLPKAK
jgi:RHS repeat-associated protein